MRGTLNPADPPHMKAASFIWSVLLSAQIFETSFSIFQTIGRLIYELASEFYCRGSNRWKDNITWDTGPRREARENEFVLTCGFGFHLYGPLVCIASLTALLLLTLPQPSAGLKRPGHLDPTGFSFLFLRSGGVALTLVALLLCVTLTPREGWKPSECFILSLSLWSVKITNMRC